MIPHYQYKKGRGFSQGNEEAHILEYFKDFKGHLVDIGANDGVTFSNSRQLILNGWSADLFEPVTSPFKKLERLYKDNEKVNCHKLAIGLEKGTVDIHVNEPHIYGDDGLLSTIKEEELDRWPHIEFIIQKCHVIEWPNIKADFISIDAEGLDYEILRQIDLTEVKCVCVEWNGKDRDQYNDYCTNYGLKNTLLNKENLIFTR